MSSGTPLFRVLTVRRPLDVSLDEAPFYVLMDYVDAYDLKQWCARRVG